MKFDLPKRDHPNLEKYEKHDVDTAYQFANDLYKEMGGLIRGVIIFGSSARETTTTKSDIDILVIIDDLTISLSPEVIEAYRVIINKIIVKVSTRLHITTLRFTAESIWTYYIRAPNTLHNSKWHLLQATLDLYWAVIDAAHAALMKHGE